MKTGYEAMAAAMEVQAPLTQHEGEHNMLENAGTGGLTTGTYSE